MASNIMDNVLHWRKKLERNTDDDANLCVIRKLSKVPVTIDLLQGTGIGKVVRALAKKPGKVGEKASAVLHNWRKVVAGAQKSSDHSPKTSHVKHDSRKRENYDKDNIVPNTHMRSTLTFEKKSSKEKYSSDLKYGQESENLFHKHKDILAEPTKLDMFRDIYLDQYESSAFLHSAEEYEPLANDTDNEELYSDRKRKTCDTSEDLQPVTKKLKTESMGKPSSHNSYEKKEKERKSHNSNGQSSKPSSRDSQSHKQVDKIPDTKKSKKNKTKKDTKNNHSDLQITLKMQSTDAFTCSEVRFEDCLSFNDIVPVKRKKSSKSSSSGSKTSSSSSKASSSGSKTSSSSSKASSSGSKTSSSMIKTQLVDISEHKKPGNDITKSKHSDQSKSKHSHQSKPKHSDQSKSKHSDQSKSKHSLNPTTTSKALKQKEEKKEKMSLAPLAKSIEIDIASTLPQPQLNYRPLPQRNFDFFPVKRKALSNEDAIKFTSSKKEKTAVYSGRKNFLTAVPTLQESCTRVLIEHIDAIEYLGSLPYYLMKPVLERCSAHQLENIEEYNPDLLEDTHELWEIHCKKDFRTLQPQENETWRDMYLRAFDEREKKLKALTRNISNSMISKSSAGRLVKLTYVNSYVKPPRDVARKQEKNGTGLPVNHTMKAGPPSKASPRPTAPAINSAAKSSAKSDCVVPKNAKPKVAPLMAKTLKSMKQCFRR